MSSKKIHKIFLKGIESTDLISSYKKIGNQYSVTFKNGKTFKYNESNVLIKQVENDSIEKDCYDYLLAVASTIGLLSENYNGRVSNILLNRFPIFDEISTESVFKAYLKGDFDAYKNSNVQPIVFPFGFNFSQKTATSKALSNRVSIIEGPPGTGKTQTILNIIANIILNNKTVAVVSGNNAAVLNVFEKLKRADLDPIAAVLGNSDKKAEFINAQSSRDKFKEWQRPKEQIESLREKQQKDLIALERKIKIKEEVANLTSELRQFKTESFHYLAHAEDRDFYLNIGTAEEAIKFWLMAEEEMRLSQRSLIVRLFSRIKFWDKSLNNVRRLIDSYGAESTIKFLQKKYYILKQEYLERRVNLLEMELKQFDFDQKMKDYSDLSMIIFKDYLAQHKANKKNENYEIDEIKRNSFEFISDYPIILSTTYSLRACLSKKIMYDYVIVDESSQVDICTGSLALACAKNVVIVGDSKQLSHVVGREDADATDALFFQYKLHEAYRYKNNSLLDSFLKLKPNLPRTLLREHYRCHPKIIEFCNKKFYDNQLIVFSKSTNDTPLVVYKTVSGNHARDRMNQRQIDIIQQEVLPNLNVDVDDHSLGIVAPYRRQTNKLQEQINNSNIKIDTVDKFQGQERNIMILSTVDNEISQFVDNPNRLNVAISRAIDKLIVVVNEHESLRDKNIGELIDYIEYNNLEVVNSKINSVFDLLYKQYKVEKERYLRGKKRLSKFDSENLINALLSDIFQDVRLSGHSFVSNIPLKNIFNDFSNLTEEENRYASNYRTHVDFLIYSSITKKPQFAIEVDGYQFHKDGTKQSVRDRLKDSIFQKMGIPLLRLKTIGSGEREKILEFILSNS